MTKNIRDRMYELAAMAVKSGMSVRKASELYGVDQAILACKVAA